MAPSEAEGADIPAIARDFIDEDFDKIDPRLDGWLKELTKVCTGCDERWGHHSLAWFCLWGTCTENYRLPVAPQLHGRQRGSKT